LDPRIWRRGRAGLPIERLAWICNPVAGVSRVSCAYATHEAPQPRIRANLQVAAVASRCMPKRAWQAMPSARSARAGPCHGRARTYPAPIDPRLDLRSAPCPLRHLGILLCSSGVGLGGPFGPKFKLVTLPRLPACPCKHCRPRRLGQGVSGPESRRQTVWIGGAFCAVPGSAGTAQRAGARLARGPMPVQIAVHDRVTGDELGERSARLRASDSADPQGRGGPHHAPSLASQLGRG
jgi:hypothetical protein